MLAVTKNRSHPCGRIQRLGWYQKVTGVGKGGRLRYFTFSRGENSENAVILPPCL